MSECHFCEQPLGEEIGRDIIGDPKADTIAVLDLCESCGSKLQVIAAGLGVRLG